MLVYTLKRISKLELPEEGLVTQQQLSIPGLKIDSNPQTKILLNKREFHEGFDRFELTHETIDRTPHRLGGNFEYYDSSIIGGNEKHAVYISKVLELGVFRTSKKVANGAIKALHKEYPTQFEMLDIYIDFDRVMKKAGSNIRGAWFTDIKGQINTVAVFGDRVNQDEQFTRNRLLGHISLLYIELDLEGFDESQTIGITRNGGILFHCDSNDEKRQISLIMSLVTRLGILEDNS